VKYLIQLCFLFLTISVWGQNKHFTLKQGHAKQKDYFTVIPFDFIKGQIIINVNLNGNNYNFSMDTGAPTWISRKIHNEHSLSKIKKLKVIDSSNKKDSLEVVILKSIQLNNVEFNNIPALVVDSGTFYDCLNIEGNIGSNLLRNSVINISKEKQEITLTNSTKKLKLKKKNSTKLFLNYFQCTPYFKIDLAGKEKAKAKIVFDSGMEGMFDLALQHYELLRKYEIFKNTENANGSISIGIFGNANDTLHYRMLVPRLTLGQTVLTNALVKTTQDRNSRIGTDLLKYMDITLDYKHRRIYFSPLKEGELDAYTKTAPVSPTFENGKFLVSFIWRPQEVPTIKKGDEILKIDNINCQELSKCDILLKSGSELNKDEFVIVTKDSRDNIHSTLIKKK